MTRVLMFERVRERKFGRQVAPQPRRHLALRLMQWHFQALAYSVHP